MDCKDFIFGKSPKMYSRTVVGDYSKVRMQANMERQFFLFDENVELTNIFCVNGDVVYIILMRQHILYI